MEVDYMIVIFGLVEFVKKFKLTGQLLTWASMVIGVVVAVGWQFALKYPGFGEYYRIVLFGLAHGLAACGIYDFLNKRLAKNHVGHNVKSSTQLRNLQVRR